MSSGCNRTTCAYAGYNNQTILTRLALDSTCPANGGGKHIGGYTGALGGSQLTTEPLDLQQLENCQLEVLRNEVLSEERSRGCFSAKASHKISTHLGPKYLSRYGESPQPVPSSSLKRSATVNASKAAAKELKLPKVPGSVTGFSSIRATKSSMLRVNHLKHNQITQPVTHGIGSV